MSRCFLSNESNNIQQIMKMKLFYPAIVFFFVVIVDTIQAESIDEELKSLIMGPMVLNNSTSNRTTVKFIMALPFFMGSVFVAGPYEALKRLQSLDNWLPNYDVDLEWIDDWCTSEIHVSEIGTRLHLSKESKNRLPVIATGGCDGVGLKIIGEVASYFNHISFSWINTSPAVITNRDRYGSLFLLGEPYESVFRSVTTFIQRNNWTTVGLISERYEFYDYINGIMSDLLKEGNIEVSFFQRVQYWDYDEEEHRKVMTEMAEIDPRIILVYADIVMPKICWFHRMGLYGPNYVYFIFAFSDLNSFNSIAIPPEVADWCSETMVKEVLETAFLFGESSRTKVFKNETDDYGWNVAKFDANVNSYIEDVQLQWGYGCCRLLPHDLTMFIGLVLNKTEEILQTTRNETLSDWFVDSEKFQTNGSVFSSILKESIYQTQYRGLVGEFHFDTLTKMNSKGYTPIEISQQINGNEEVIAIYKSNNDNDNKLIIYDHLLEWRGPNRKPPLDHVIFQETSYGTLPFWLFVLFSTVAAIGIAIISGLLLYQRTVKKHRTPRFIIATGTMVMLGHIFILPHGKMIDYHCTAVTGILLFSCSVIFIGFGFLFVSLKKEIALLASNKRIAVPKGQQSTNKFNSNISARRSTVTAAKKSWTMVPVDKSAVINGVGQHWKFSIFLLIIAAGLLMLWISFQSLSINQHTLIPEGSTVGKTSVNLIIYLQCGFDEQHPEAPWLILAQVVPILFSTIQAGLSIFNMKQTDLLRNNTSGVSKVVNIFGICITIIIGCSLVAYIMIWQLFHVSALVALIITIPITILIYHKQL